VLGMTIAIRQMTIDFRQMTIDFRHCEPTGPRKARPDDRLREAIHLTRERRMDCFVASLLAMTAMVKRRDALYVR